MVALATILGAALLVWWPSPTAMQDLGPLRSQTVTFRADYSETYLIGLRFDQTRAKRAFPCVVDPAKFGDRCPPAERKLRPANPKLILQLSDGTPQPLEPDRSDAGGVYLGREAFIWPLSYVRLHAGRSYRLSASVDPIAEPAGANLVLSVATPGFGERQALTSLLRWSAAALLGLLATAVWLKGRKSHPPTQ